VSLLHFLFGQRASSRLEAVILYSFPQEQVTKIHFAPPGAPLRRLPGDPPTGLMIVLRYEDKSTDARLTSTYLASSVLRAG
jgi:hypothetical protein